MTRRRPDSTRLPKIGTSAIAEEGIGIVQALSNAPRVRGGLGCLFRPQQSADVGIDGHLEIVDEITDEPTGQIVGVQVKTGPSYFVNPTSDGWILHLKRETVRYWLQYKVPVILIVVDVDARAAYWVRIDATTVIQTSKAYNLLIPKSHQYDESARSAIAGIAENAPPSLRSTIELPATWMRAVAEVRQAYKSATSRSARSRAARLGRNLSARLRDAGFLYEAARVGRQAAHAFLRAAATKQTASRS